jgi:hypothetical protein
VRHSVKPGVTGWAQVSYHYGSTVDDSIQKLQYDLYYVKNHSAVPRFGDSLSDGRRGADGQGRSMTLPQGAAVRRRVATREDCRS